MMVNQQIVEEKIVFININAYVEKLIFTVVHIATFEATEFFGKFNVIWERVSSPNMRNPIVAKEPYIAVHRAKLFPTEG